MKTVFILQNGAHFGGAERALLNVINSNQEINFIIYSYVKRKYLEAFNTNNSKVFIPDSIIIKIVTKLGSKLRGTWVAREIISSFYLILLMKSKGVNEVHINIPFPKMNICLFMLRMLGCTYTLHQRSLLSQVKLPEPFVRRARSIICVSNTVRDEMISAYSHLKSKFISIYDGAVDNSQNIIPKVKNTTFRFAVVATLEYRKGIDIAIEAFYNAQKVIPGRTELLIVGQATEYSGEYTQRLHDTVQQLGLNDKVIFTGQIDNMSEIYKQSEVVLVLSRDGEALGLVGIEAMAYGCLVLGHEKGAIKEYLVDGITGIGINNLEISTITKQMVRAYKDWDNLSNIRQNGQIRVKSDFSIDNQAKKIGQALGWHEQS